MNIGSVLILWTALWWTALWLRREMREHIDIGWIGNTRAARLSAQPLRELGSAGVVPVIG